MGLTVCLFTCCGLFFQKIKGSGLKQVVETKA